MEMPDFDQLEAALERADADVDAAESHGILCGMLSGRRPPGPAGWIGEVLGDSPEGDVLARECHRMLENLYVATERQMDDVNLPFQPLLPDDNAGLEERVAELGRWCQGFLYGLGLAGSADLDALPEASREIIGDIAEIANAGRYGMEDAEEDERAFAEILEYVRVGVLLVREEAREPESEKPTLH